MSESVDVEAIREQAHRHAKRAWWSNNVSESGEPLDDYPAVAFNVGLAELNESFDYIAAALREKDERIAELERENEAVRQERDDELFEERACAQRAEAEVERLRSRIAELEANEKDWSDQARRYCERIAELDAMLVASEEHTRHHEAEAGRLRERIAELERERDVLFKGDWAMLNQRLEYAEAENAKLREALERLRYHATMLVDACERMGDRGVEESAPALRAALDPEAQPADDIERLESTGGVC